MPGASEPLRWWSTCSIPSPCGTPSPGNEAVCNLATHIPSVARMALPGAWRANDRIRTEVSANLVDAAQAGGATRFVQESICLLHADGGDVWLDEDSSLDPRGQVRSAVVAEGHAARFTRSGRPGVVLRFGLFHGPDSDTTVLALRLARRGVSATLGGPTGYQSPITTDDAAAAVAAALRAPPGTYEIVDDEPLTGAQYASALAAAVGRQSLRIPPRAAGRLGGGAAAVLSRSLRISNGRFRQATGWRPATPSLRQAWPAIIAAMGLVDDEGRPGPSLP